MTQQDAVYSLFRVYFHQEDACHSSREGEQVMSLVVSNNVLTLSIQISYLIVIVIIVVLWTLFTRRR